MTSVKNINKYFFIMIFFVMFPISSACASYDELIAVVIKRDAYENDISNSSNTPRNLSVALNQSNQALVTWNDRSDFEGGYLVERKDGAQGEFMILSSLPSNSEYYVDEYLEPGNSYSYRVRAFMATNFSQYSNEDGVYVPADAVVIEKEVVTREEIANIDRTVTSVASLVKNKFIEIVKEKETISRVIAIVGAASGSVVAATATTVPFLPLVPQPLQSSLFSFMLLPFYRRKSKESWGVVFDDYTKQPIKGVILSLVNSRGMLIEKTMTDKEGRYGFLISKAGDYQLNAKKGQYKIKSQDERDSVYGDVYHGGFIHMDTKGIIRMNIALDPEGFDWNEFSIRVTKKYNSFSSVLKKYSLIILGIVGLCFSVGVAYFNPNTINYLILAFHSFVIVWQIVSRFKKPFGMIKSEANKKPMPFTIVALYDDLGKRAFFTVSDVIGRYYLLAKNGNYSLKLKGRAEGGKYITKEESHVKIKKEMLKKDYLL
ncbi:fibronectin type III domain-containing protein [Patescibacteria group bacterium]